MTLKVMGTNFPTQAAILWNGAPLATTAVDANTLSGTVGSSSLANPGTAQLQVRNTQTLQESQAVQVTIAAQNTGSSPLTISINPLPQGVLGTQYTGTLTATGGTAPYTWSLSSGKLPAGLSLAPSTGVISGTPTANGSYSFSVSVSDSGSQSATTTVTLTVSTTAVQPSPLTIAVTPLPQGILGTAYTGTLTATGGTAPYTWTLASGQLPPGLSLAPNSGVLSGTPTTSGNYSFGVSVSDSGSQSTTTTVTVTISAASNKPSTLTLASSSLASGSVNSAYSTSLQAAGGAAPYNWSASGLPPGLNVAPSTGVISGTPTASGTFNFTATVSDAGNPAQSTSATLSIVIAPVPLRILYSSLPSGTQSSNYSSALQASGGSGSYSWSISSGTLPAGLTLAANGVISGTPTANGNFSFGAMVTDTSSPAQTATGNVTLVIIAAGTPLAISSTSLPGGTQNQNYSGTLNATGGTAPYTWSATGSLPSGLALVAGTGVISGSPTAIGTASFTVKVKDSSNPAQTSSLQLSIAIVAPPPLTISALLPPATVSTAYTTSVGASGGNPTYTWSISVGSLPPGLTMAATTGAISGTPTTSGTYTFTAAVSDSSSPVQSKSIPSSIVVAAAAQPGVQNTWYVRPDGGTRYSSNAPTGQCDGLGDAAYPGSGVNQHCAFNDVRYFWTDGVTYCTDNSATSTCWTWIGQGGDTFIVRGSIGTGVTYRIGANGPNSGDWFGLPGNPYGAGVPTPHSGTASAHTKILGENFASCSAQSARTQLHGGYGVGAVLNMGGAAYVDVACFDITDFSACGRSSQLNGCNTNYPLDDYSGIGIAWSNTANHDTITDVRIHGMASLGMSGPTGDGVVMTGVDIIGNAGAGWNSDNGNGDQSALGQGATLVQNFTIAWNGCAEEYPIVDPLPYQDCTDDNIGGYGDGFGTATVNNTGTGWQVHFDQGVVNNNTQDGLDALHLTGGGSSMTITRVLAYGNMGQQIKVGGSQGTANNNVIFTNCNAMRQAIPGTPSGYNTRLSDFCRAADTGVVMTVSSGTTTTFDFNTIYSASATGIEVDCGAAVCDGTTVIDFRNNIFLGFLNNTATGYPNGGTGDFSNPIYLGVTTTNPFTNPGSANSNNLTYHWKSSWSCPANWLNEVNALCVDPNLTDETWHLYGPGNALPLSNSPVIGAGTALPSITIDYTGKARTTPPNIGAYN